MRGPGKLSSGQFSPSNGPAGPGSPSILNPQQRHVRCGAVSARKWSRWLHFSEQRAGRPRAGIFAERSLPRGEKIHTLRLCRPGLRGPGKLSCGQFSPSNGPAGSGKTRKAKARGFPKWGSEAPENRPVACFHRRTGRQALVVSPCRGLCNSPLKKIRSGPAF